MMEESKESKEMKEELDDIFALVVKSYIAEFQLLDRAIVEKIEKDARKEMVQNIASLNNELLTTATAKAYAATACLKGQISTGSFSFHGSCKIRSKQMSHKDKGIGGKFDEKVFCGRTVDGGGRERYRIKREG